MIPTSQRFTAGGLAALGAVSAIPIPIAQLDFHGLINTFQIDSGGSPHALHVIVGVAGLLTIGVLVLALVGMVLALTGSPAARPVLIAAAVAGLVTALPGWVPAGIVLGSAALVIGRELPTNTSGRVCTPQPLH